MRKRSEHKRFADNYKYVLLYYYLKKYINILWDIDIPIVIFWFSPSLWTSGPTANWFSLANQCIMSFGEWILSYIYFLCIYFVRYCIAVALWEEMAPNTFNKINKYNHRKIWKKINF